MNRAFAKNPFTDLMDRSAALAGARHYLSQRNSGGNLYIGSTLVLTSGEPNVDPENVKVHYAMYWLDNYNDPEAVYYRSYGRNKYNL